jgi:hypothetical protein
MQLLTFTCIRITLTLTEHQKQANRDAAAQTIENEIASIDKMNEHTGVTRQEKIKRSIAFDATLVASREEATKQFRKQKVDDLKITQNATEHLKNLREKYRAAAKQLEVANGEAALLTENIHAEDMKIDQTFAEFKDASARQQIAIKSISNIVEEIEGKSISEGDDLGSFVDLDTCIDVKQRLSFAIRGLADQKERHTDLRILGAGVDVKFTKEVEEQTKKIGSALDAVRTLNPEDLLKAWKEREKLQNFLVKFDLAVTELQSLKGGIKQQLASALKVADLPLPKIETTEQPKYVVYPTVPPCTSY